MFFPLFFPLSCPDPCFAPEAGYTPETAGACKRSEDYANYHKPLGSADPGEQGQDRKAHIKNGPPPTKTEALKKCRSALHFIEWGRIMEAAR